MRQKTAKKPRRNKAEPTAETIRQQIVDRVRPAPKVNPNLPKRKHPYKEGSPGFSRAAQGLTLTSIRKIINAPVEFSVAEVDEHGEYLGDIIEEMKPDAATKLARRDHFVERGLLSSFPRNNERRKVHKRNKRYAACNSKGSKPPKKSWHKAKKVA